MNISGFGLGYVGTVCSGCLASEGHAIVGVDVNVAKVEGVNTGVAPIVEPKLPELFAEAHGPSVSPPRFQPPRLLAAAERAWSSATGPRSPRGALRDLLLLTAQWLFGRPSLYWIPASLPFLGLGETVYRPAHPVGGISALAAGELGRTRPLARAEAQVRRDNALRIQTALLESTHLRAPEGWMAGLLRYPVVLQRTAEAQTSRYYVACGVSRGYPGSIAELPGFGARRINTQDGFLGADELVRRLVTLPAHQHVRSARVPAF